MPTGSFDPNNLDAALDEAVKYASGSSPESDASGRRGAARGTSRPDARDGGRPVPRDTARPTRGEGARSASREDGDDARESRESREAREAARQARREATARPGSRGSRVDDSARRDSGRRSGAQPEGDVDETPRAGRSLFASARHLAAAAGERLSHLSSNFGRSDARDEAPTDTARPADRSADTGRSRTRHTDRSEPADRSDRPERIARPERAARAAGIARTEPDAGDLSADTGQPGFEPSLPGLSLDHPEPPDALEATGFDVAPGTQAQGEASTLAAHADAGDSPGTPMVAAPSAGAESPGLPAPKMVPGPDGTLINSRLIKPIDKQRLPPGRLLARAGELLSSASGGRTVLIVISMYRSDRLLALGQEASSREVMIEVVRRIRTILRPHDRYAIASHEEVWMLLADLPSASLAELAVRTLQQSLARPIHARTAEDKETVVQLRPAVGAAWSSEAGKIDSMILLSAASEAARAADKTEERVCISRLETAEAILNRNSLEQDLRHALQNNELEVHFQPQIELSSMRCVAVEALIRWTNSEHGPISPALIATLCEERGMMAQLTHFVLNTTLRHMMFWRGQKVNVTVAINISALSLADPTFPTQVAQALSTWGADPQRLTLELTESSIVQNERAALEFMTELSRMGCRLSIDDFGTGYSSLAYLRQFPLNELKIDKTFVKHLADGHGDQRIVQVLVDLAHTFGMRALAEGVETDAGVALLQQLGCDLAQGYLYSRPLPAKDFLVWYRDREAAIAAGRQDLLAADDPTPDEPGSIPALEPREGPVINPARTLFGTGGHGPSAVAAPPATDPTTVETPAAPEGTGVAAAGPTPPLTNGG